MQKLIECVPNFSEGRNKKVINAIYNSALRYSRGKGVKVIELESDASHNRMLFTIVGAPDDVLDSVFESIKVATKLIDMNKHKGEHPRIGATDVVPFVPISGATMNDCILLSNKLARKVASELEIPVYLYEAAAKSPDRLNLADIRKGEYEGLKIDIAKDKKRKPDYGTGKLHPTAGAIVIGARKYLIAYNVNLDTKDVEIAKKIAKKIRERDGGMPGVKALGFDVGGYAQVSMNLVDYEKTNFDEVYRQIERLAKIYKVKIKNSEIYGMIPLEALVRLIQRTFKADNFSSNQVLENRLFE
jgi:glutamate formiminotransferase